MTAEQFGRGIGPFSLIPNQILDSAPDYHIIMVWCAIWRHGNGSDEGCWASVQRISKVARIGRDRTRSAIQWLKENNWLIAEERPGFTTRYRCTLENGNRQSPDYLPLNSAQWQPLLDTSTPTGHQEGTPTGCQEGNYIPLTKSRNSLLSSGISDEIPTDAAENEFSAQLAMPVNGGRKKAQAKGDDDFELFWKTYLAAPVRASSQSKPKALAQWQKTIRTQSAHSLQEALETEIAFQRGVAPGAFVCPLPDCFRWLRDERYNAVADRPITTVNDIPDVIR